MGERKKRPPCRKRKKGQKKKKRMKTAPQPPATVTAAPSGSTAGIGLSDIQTVKELITRVGVTTLKDLIDVFSK